MKFIIGRNLISLPLSAPKTFMDDDLPLLPLKVELDRFHKSAARILPIPRHFFIHVEGGEALSAVVSAASLEGGILCVAVQASEAFIAMDEIFPLL